jgi:hypothetical protein
MVSFFGDLGMGDAMKLGYSTDYFMRNPIHSLEPIVAKKSHENLYELFA